MGIGFNSPSRSLRLTVISEQAQRVASCFRSISVGSAVAVWFWLMMISHLLKWHHQNTGKIKTRFSYVPV